MAATLSNDRIDTTDPAQQGPHLCGGLALPDRGHGKRDAEQVEGVQQAQPDLGRHRIIRRQKTVKGAVKDATPPGWAASTRSAAHDASSSRSSSAATASKPIIGSTGTPTSPEKCAQRVCASAIGPSPAKHRSNRLCSAPPVPDVARRRCVGVLGFDHFGGDVDDHVDVQVGGRAPTSVHRDPRRDSGAVQGVRHRVATHSATSADGHAQRCGGSLGDRRHAARSAAPAANRASSSTKIWWPCPFMSCLLDPMSPIAPAACAVTTAPGQLPYPIAHRMVAPASPRCEPPFICYQLKATVGYQSGPEAATSGVHGPPWTNACATRGEGTSRHTGGGAATQPGPSSASTGRRRASSSGQ